MNCLHAKRIVNKSIYINNKKYIGLGPAARMCWPSPTSDTGLDSKLEVVTNRTYRLDQVGIRALLGSATVRAPITQGTKK